MFRYTIVLIAGLGLAGCAMDGADPVGEGPQDDRRMTQEAPGIEEKDLALPIGERRTSFRQDVDRSLAELDGWLEKRAADAGEAVDEGAAEVEHELKALREEIARLGDATDAEWEKAKANLRERIDKLQRRVDELGEPG